MKTWLFKLLERKDQALVLAELIDAFRVLPRLYLAVYILILWTGHDWYMDLEKPLADQLSYLQSLWLAAGGITGIYMATGRKWRR